MITRELLNKSRVLTMSNNRKCDYLVVNVDIDVERGNYIVFILGVNTKNNTNDILIVKTLTGENIEELVEEVYWICIEFNIHKVLCSTLGHGIEFVYCFKKNIDPNDIHMIAVNEKIKFTFTNAYSNIERDLQNGKLRFLQSVELVRTYYKKPFLGYSEILHFHKETDNLIDEIANIKLDVTTDGFLKYNKIDKKIGDSQLINLLILYNYPANVDTHIE